MVLTAVINSTTQGSMIGGSNDGKDVGSVTIRWQPSWTSPVLTGARDLALLLLGVLIPLCLISRPYRRALWCLLPLGLLALIPFNLNALATTGALAITLVFAFVLTKR